MTQEETVVKALTAAIAAELETVRRAPAESRWGEQWPVACEELWEALECEVTIEFPGDDGVAAACVLWPDGDGEPAGYEAPLADFDPAAAARAAYAVAKQTAEGRDDE